MYGARRVILKLGIGRCGLSVLYTFSRVEQGDNLQWLWFGGFVITTISPNILRKFDERNLCSALHLKGEKKREAKWRTRRKLNTPSLQRRDCCAATGRFWTDGRSRQPFVRHLYPMHSQLYGSGW